MMLTKWQPYTKLMDLPRAFSRFFGPDFFGEDEDRELSTPVWRPAVDVFETKDEYVFKFELPGVSKDDISIEYENGTLTVKGERKEEKEVNKENLHRIERYYGAFCRSFNIPKNIDDKKISANMKDGILELKAPKAEEAKPKAIPINLN